MPALTQLPGDCLDVLPTLDAGSVQCVVTSSFRHCMMPCPVVNRRAVNTDCVQRSGLLPETLTPSNQFFGQSVMSSPSLVNTQSLYEQFWYAWSTRLTVIKWKGKQRAIFYGLSHLISAGVTKDNAHLIACYQWQFWPVWELFCKPIRYLCVLAIFAFSQFKYCFRLNLLDAKKWLQCFTCLGSYFVCRAPTIHRPTVFCLRLAKIHIAAKNRTKKLRHNWSDLVQSNTLAIGCIEGVLSNAPMIRGLSDSEIPVAVHGTRKIRI